MQFENLGLVIIDEEQRFGVAVKERLKALRAAVDVLTMTATPIPRTLHMSLLGVRNISNLETAPKDRLAVETRIARFDEQLIRHAVLRELNRDGQVYFVHNRVHDIHALAAKLQRIVPEATIGIGHGQMPESELEDVILGFVRHEFDILAGHDDHRERHGHSQRQHDVHRRRRSLRAGRLASAAWSRRVGTSIGRIAIC